MRRRPLLAAATGALGGALIACTQLPVAGPGPVAAPLPMPAGPLRRIAFGSCIDQDKPQPIWSAILAQRPELFLFGGDNVYASTPPWSRERLERAYARLAANPGFAQLRATVPHLATWDDHDYGLNDGGSEFAGQQASKDAFLAFWGAPPDDPRRNHPGVYQAVRIGPPGQRVQVILLDARSFRSPLRRTDRPMAPGRERYLPDPDPAKTLLGATQWAWLEAQLRQPAELRLLVSGIQVLAEGHGWECWGNLPLERQRLLDLLERTGARNTVLLSGDRHIGAFYRQPRADGTAWSEMTSSGMTHAWAQASEAGPNRIGDLVRQNHFASIDIDWSQRRLQAALRGESGAVLHGIEIPWAAGPA